MKTIWKYNLLINETERFGVPKGGKILKVCQQGLEDVSMWILVDPSADSEERVFRIFGTGHEMEDTMGVELKYIDTFQTYGGGFVGHVFEVIS